MWKEYRRRGIIEMRPYIFGEDLSEISVSEQDKPKDGDMIARNPVNHKDQWLVAQEYFEKNYDEDYENKPTG